MYKGLMSSAVFALVAFLLSDASAQEWPTKSIRFVVPFAPGGTSEIVARSVAQELTKQLGQTVYVENKPGGAGTIAMQEVAGAAPDGYTIILGHVGTLAVNPYAMKKHPYDVNKAFLPVALLARVPNVFVINSESRRRASRNSSTTRRRIPASSITARRVTAAPVISRLSI